MAQVIKSTNGAIGYVDFSDAKASGLTLRLDQERGRQATMAPSLSGASEAVATATDPTQPDLRRPELVRGRPPTRSPSATYVIVYQKQTDTKVGKALKGWLNYLLTGARRWPSRPTSPRCRRACTQKAIAQLSQLQIG